jgi:hypothetical protein
MACLINLRSDYPLILTLPAPAYRRDLTSSYIDRRTSPRTIPVPLSRHNQRAPVRIFIRFCSHFCPFACAVSASDSTWRITPAPACLREFQLHADEQLMPTVEHQCANLLGNAEFDFRESAASLSAKSDCRCHTGARLSPAEFEERIALRFCGHSVAFLSAHSLDKSDQIKEEHIMSQSRGAVSFEPLFTAEDIGLRKEANVEHVMKVFITLGEGQASRWIEMPKGVLLLQTVPDEPASGAIYLYDRELQVFYFVVFDLGRDDSLTAPEFDQLVAEYNLVSRTAHPGLLRRAVAKHAIA